MTRHGKTWIICSLWIIAIGAAASLDRAMAMLSHAWGTDSFLHGHKLLRESIKLMGFYPFTIALAIAVAFLHAKKRRAALMLLVMTAVSGLNEPIKWIAGRARPFKTLTGDSSVLAPFDLHPFPPLDSKNLCFPSGHAALAFATAAALSILWPRFRWGFYALALVVAAERFLENAHWLSDTVAAAALGIGGVKLLRDIFWPGKTGDAEHE